MKILNQHATTQQRIYAAIVLSVCLSAASHVAAQRANVNVNTNAPSLSTTAAATVLRAADRCTGDPKFLEKVGLSKRAIVDTTSTHSVGLVVTDITPDGKPGRSMQHPTWAQAGALGRVQRDKAGNLYVYPVPSVSLVQNPIEKANIVYRLDSATGLMAPFAELPKEAEANERNPFGLLALALDCEQEALYAASVYGSTPSAENGMIARIDLKTRAVTVVRRNIDALSLMVATDARGKRLYAGTSRDNAIVSYAIARDGSVSQEEVVETKLDAIAAAQDKRPRVLRVDGRGQLYVRSIPFDYTLAARTLIPTTEMSFASPTAANEKAPDKTANKSESRLVLVDQKSTSVPMLRGLEPVAPTSTPAVPPVSSASKKD